MPENNQSRPVSGAVTSEPQIQSLLNEKIKYTNRIIKGVDSSNYRTINQYSLIKTLGEGSFGIVKLVIENETSKKYAMKMFSKLRLRKQKDIQKNALTGEMIVKNAYLDTLREIQIMAILGDKSGSIIKLHEVIDSEKDDKLLMIIDYAAFGEIMSWDEHINEFMPCLKSKKNFKEYDIQRIMRDCVIGLDFLHSNNIIHRDIKPLNIMLDEYGKAKFADFGASVIIEQNGHDRFTDTRGTYHFLSPEACDPSVKEYGGYATDVWALGVTLFALTFNVLPYGGNTDQEIVENILNTNFKFPESQEIECSEGLKNLIERMLDKNAKTRITVAELKSNPWLNEGFHYSLNDPEATQGMLSHFKQGESQEFSMEAIIYAQKLLAEKKCEFME